MKQRVAAELRYYQRGELRLDDPLLFRKVDGYAGSGTSSQLGSRRFMTSS
jgi:hypothetical protein